MAAGVSLDRAIEVVGHSRGTYAKDVARALRALGVPCADRLHVLSRTKPILPRRGMLHVGPKKKDSTGHWILIWDGVLYDPGGRWSEENKFPEEYAHWRIKSYLEIHL
jgi:hypothetical protein